ncbi:transcriptional regulator [Vibrio sp. HA2012]|uniref:TetR family transcriptional regulator n=1 Tax=Vibrio sp. HA2012 TaxID=1971595 RepID=UPI000C2BBCCB|nr:TetR family transcriptional regulator [Vibrio sp. HA2012]PJC87355.1 transcriptional regulator [Vibrio sp. HA2012]
MPKRSKEDTEITIRIIMDAVIDQLIRLGYDRMSYTSLSQQTGISRTGISHHFPKKTDFVSALDERIHEKFIQHLNLCDGLKAFSESWLVALNNQEFASILRLLFHHIVMVDCADSFARNGMNRLYRMMDEQYGEKADKELEWLLGKSLVHLT